MLKPQSEKWIALSVVASAVVLVFALTVAVGKISLHPGKRIIHVRFESVAGLQPNSMVKFAGAWVGRVDKIRVLPRKDQVKTDKGAYFVEIDAEVENNLDIGSDITASIKQDGLLGPKYVALSPGSIDAPLLADGAVLYGEQTVEVTDLAGPGKALLTDLQHITGKMNEALPEILAHADNVLQSGDSILSSIKSPEDKERIRKLLANLKVISDNLKVVSTNAKVMTTTLGERPWSLIWGGEPNKLPSEADILASDKPLPAKPSDDETKTAAVKKH